MPITSRFLRKYNPQTDGRANVREVHVDSLGNQITRDYKTTKTQVDVELDMNARDLTSTLVGRDVSEVIRHVESGNDTSTFDYTDRDITEDEAEEAVFTHFAESKGDEAIKYAWWMDSINTGKFNAIRDRIGYTALQGADITSRFTFMVSVEPWYDLTESV